MGRLGKRATVGRGNLSFLSCVGPRRALQVADWSFPVRFPTHGHFYSGLDGVVILGVNGRSRAERVLRRPEENAVDGAEDTSTSIEERESRNMYRCYDRESVQSAERVLSADA